MTNWQGQYHNPKQGTWKITRRVSTPFGTDEVDGEFQPVDVEIVDDEEFQNLALQAEFQENVYEAYTETGLPQGDQTFDQIVNEMVGDLPL